MTARDDRNWMLGLKAGDVVCDCRYKHLRIASIEDGIQIWRFLNWMLVEAPLPESVFSKLSDLAIKAKMTTVIDKDLVLEDGYACSAVHCCDPADDHEEASHAEAIELAHSEGRHQ